MAFFRKQVVTRNGKRYEYRRLVASKRIKGKENPVHVYLGKVREEDKGLRFIEQQMQEYPRQSVDDPPNDVLKEKAPIEEAGVTPALDGQRSETDAPTEGAT